MVVTGILSTLATTQNYSRIRFSTKITVDSCRYRITYTQMHVLSDFIAYSAVEKKGFLDIEKHFANAVLAF